MQKRHNYNFSDIKSAKGINFTNVDFRDRSYNFRGVDLTDAIFEGVKNNHYIRKD